MRAEGRSRLVVFDVEGVIIPKVRFLLFEVFGKVGLKSFIKAAFYGLQYFLGLASLKEALEKSYRLLCGVSHDRFILFFQKITLMPGVEAVFRELRNDGCRTALISSGMPRIAVEGLAGKLGSDYASGVEVGVSDGRLTGEIWGDVIEPDGKATALKKILDEHHLESSHSYAVADDRNNLPLFRLCNVKIGYNPDFVLRYSSDHVVKGELAEILPIIRDESSKHPRGRFSGKDALRKAIHIGGFSTTILASFMVDRFTLALIIALVTLLYLGSEILRMVGVMTPVVSQITGMAAGESEFQEFVASPVSYAIGIIIALVVFPSQIGYASIAVLTLGDGFASVLGGISAGWRLPFSKDKTVVGSLGGFLLAFLGALLFVEPYRASLASFIGMLAEVIPSPIDDNVTIPLASGLTLMALTMI